MVFALADVEMPGSQEDGGEAEGPGVKQGSGGEEVEDGGNGQREGDIQHGAEEEMEGAPSTQVAQPAEIVKDQRADHQHQGGDGDAIQRGGCGRSRE